MFALIYITTSSKAESTLIGNKLVSDRLVGCANIISEIKSFYWWHGNLEEDSESLLVVKSLLSNVDNIVKRVKELHSYENPCVVAIPIINGSKKNHTWKKKLIKFEKKIE